MGSGGLEQASLFGTLACHSSVVSSARRGSCDTWSLRYTRGHGDGGIRDTQGRRSKRTGPGSTAPHPIAHRGLLALLFSCSAVLYSL